MAVSGCPAIEPEDKSPHANSTNAQQNANKPSNCHRSAPKGAPRPPNRT